MRLSEDSHALELMPSFPNPFPPNICQNLECLSKGSKDSPALLSFVSSPASSPNLPEEEKPKLIDASSAPSPQIAQSESCGQALSITTWECGQVVISAVIFSIIPLMYLGTIIVLLHLQQSVGVDFSSRPGDSPSSTQVPASHQCGQCVQVR